LVLERLRELARLSLHLQRPRLHLPK
jgi:hypothetical protein